MKHQGSGKSENRFYRSGDGRGCGGPDKRIWVILVVVIAAIPTAEIACRREQPPNTASGSAAGQSVGAASGQDRDRAIPGATKPQKAPPAQTTPAKNPLLDRLEADKPAVVVFSARTCCGGDSMADVAIALQARHSNVLHVVCVDAFRERSVALQCGVETIPTLILYDAKGNEKVRLTDPATVEEIEQKLGEIGVK